MADVTGGAAVLTERVSDHILLVTINRPEARNAINGAVTQGLAQAVKTVEEDPSLWGAILTGAGDMSFSAGADLKEIQAGNAASLLTPEGGFAGFVYARKTKFWIAAVNGFALGGGTELSLACDMIVASEKAAFGLPEVKRGLMALAGGIFRLPRAIPKAIALELIATGEPLDPQRAAALGLVNRVVPADRLLAEAIQLAEKICLNSPCAVRESLTIARSASALSDAELIALGEEAWGRVSKSADYKEGIQAFIERRAPRWPGV